MLSTKNREDSQQNISYSPSLSQSKSNKINYFTESNYDNINSHDMSINSLEIADGLKELLIKYGFTLEELLTMPTSDLAEFLGIDLYIAKIICTAQGNHLTAVIVFRILRRDLTVTSSGKNECRNKNRRKEYSYDMLYL